jgi:hypothetical protein
MDIRLFPAVIMALDTVTKSHQGLWQGLFPKYGKVTDIPKVLVG